MNARIAIVQALGFVLIAAGTTLSSAQETAKQDTKIKQVLDRFVATKANQPNKLPGVVAAIVCEGQPPQVAASGVRSSSESNLITVEDKLHLGSCTKAITATLIGRLVDQKKLKWDSTIKDVLPKLAKQIHADYGDVTIRQLLMHRSGMPAQAKNWWLLEGNNVTKRRFSIAKHTLGDKPKQKPGARYLYSNLGYMVAGLMAAEATGQSWERLVRDEIFKPLGIKSGGFGPPGKKNKTDQPRGHRLDGKKFAPLYHDNPPALGPAGTVHLSIGDWAKFTQQHCGGNLNKICSKESMEVIQKTWEGASGEGADYACGWTIVGKGDSLVLTHNGSNTMWYASVIVSPNAKTSYLCVANIDSPAARTSVGEIVRKLVEIDAASKKARPTSEK